MKVANTGTGARNHPVRHACPAQAGRRPPGRARRSPSPPAAETTLTLTRGTVDGDLVLTPSSGSALRLALQQAPVRRPRRPTSTVPSPTRRRVEQLNGVARSRHRAAAHARAARSSGGAFSHGADTSGGQTIDTTRRSPAARRRRPAMVLGVPHGRAPRRRSTATAVLTSTESPAPRVRLPTYRRPRGHRELHRHRRRPQSAPGAAGLGLRPTAGDRPGDEHRRTRRVTIENVALSGTGWAQVSGPSAPFTIAPAGEALLVLTPRQRGWRDRPRPATSPCTALRLDLPKAPAPDPDPEPAPCPIRRPAAGSSTARRTITGGGLQLTPPAADQKGTAFWPTALEMSSGLTIEYDATIADGTGADGLTMALTDPARGAAPTSARGRRRNLGFGGIPGGGGRQLPHGTQTRGTSASVTARSPARGRP